MHIQALQLKHTLHFFDIQLQFNYPQCPVTLILGNQGTGKTTLLRFSYQALTWFAARYRDSRAAGLVMQDQDIMQNRLQSKIDIQIGFPEEMGSLPESSQSEPANLQSCSWQIYKTLNSQGLGFSKAETSQLESVLSLYQKARLHDPLLGLPLIAYYPAERFTNEVNLLNKNNPAILQSAHAYEITAIPFTTFARFLNGFVKSVILKMRKVLSLWIRFWRVPYSSQRIFAEMNWPGRSRKPRHICMHQISPL